VGDYHKLGRVMNNCPSGTYFGHEAFYSYGKMELVRGLNEDIITQPTKGLLDVVYGCTLCGSCSVNCKDHSGLGYRAEDTVKIMEDLRAYLAEIGWGPLPVQAKYGESVRTNHNPYYEPSEKRAAWANGSKYPRKAETLYFVGCTASYRQQMIAQSTVQIFKKLGIEFALLGEDEWCCGSPLLRTGQRKLAEEVAKHNVDVIKDSGAKRVVTSCAGCYKTLKLDYPKMFGLKPEFEIMTTADLLDSLLREGKLRFSRPLNLHVTYHDPCHSGRHVSIYLPELEKEKVFEPPRNVLKALPGGEAHGDAPQQGALLVLRGGGWGQVGLSRLGHLDRHGEAQGGPGDGGPGHRIHLPVLPQEPERCRGGLQDTAPGLRPDGAGGPGPLNKIPFRAPRVLP
jgi:heterodisulfide reductase subunit D